MDYINNLNLRYSNAKEEDRVENFMINIIMIEEIFKIGIDKIAEIEEFSMDKIEVDLDMDKITGIITGKETLEVM